MDDFGVAFGADFDPAARCGFGTSWDFGRFAASPWGRFRLRQLPLRIRLRRVDADSNVDSGVDSDEYVVSSCWLVAGLQLLSGVCSLSAAHVSEELTLVSVQSPVCLSWIWPDFVPM